MIPTWLPALLNLDGNWEENLKVLYSIFETDFIQHQPEIDGIPVWHDRTIKEKPYPEGFWHVITKKEKITGDRVPDFRRAERLPWCGPSLDNSDDPIIMKWDIEEDGGIKTYVWLENFDYVIILTNKLFRVGKVKFLTTAFYVTGDSIRNKLMKKYENRIL